MSVDLGFVDKSCKLLESRFFPSKIGGKPSWLDLKNIPESKDLICDVCNQPRYFLCQIYCPYNEKDTSFHRTLFVFLCLSKNCFQSNSNRNFIVFRNQLPRENSCYPALPPTEDVSWRPDINCRTFGVKLCEICGIRSCEELYQKDDETFCSAAHRNIFERTLGKASQKENLALLPEFGINIEPEDDYSDESCSESDDAESEAESVENTDAPNYSQIRGIATAQDDPMVERFFSQCNESILDKYFLNFKSRIMENPEQVIRYARGTKPLWLSSKFIPQDSEIPPCEYCSSEREFEFQILPQLLNYLNLDKNEKSTVGVFDWGTLAVYTCKNSCDSGPAYKQEFLWKQDLVE
ncbi:programmed cell death protein 2 [Planococcus citri]|uniref:programmed cell death protein 2 n=1 Tax=Planococcus citri TaxID=170843 RepID=UPI0031FA207B